MSEMPIKTKILIKNGNVIDGNGGEIQENISILIVDGKITEIYKSKEKADPTDLTAEPIAASDKYIMPGLIDCHVHYGGVYESSDKDWVGENDFEQAIRSVEQCHQSLRHGFTTVRDISRKGIYLRNMIDRGFIMGPRIIPCGRGLTRTGGHADSLHFPQEFVKEHHPWGIIADGPDEVRKAVRGLLREGSQCIKLWASGGGINEWERETDTHFTEEEIKIMVDEAKLFKVPVAAHCENKDSIIKCIKAGVNSIEHGEEFDVEVAKWFNETYLSMGQQPPNITLVPTIGLYIDWYEQFDPPKGRDHSKCKKFDDEGHPISLGKQEIERITESFKIARDLGIRIAVGADSFCSKLTPYGMYTHNEMYELKNAGMNESEIIVAATKNGAICLGIYDKTGSIEENKDADILILNENPLTDIKNISLENIACIVKRGEVVNFNNMSNMDVATINAKKERTKEQAK